MNLTFRQLEIFLLAGRILNFSKVAATLEMTPPAITKQIASLENECNFQLFEQVGKKMYLTDAGKRLLEKAELLNAELDKFKKFVADMNSNEQVIDVSLGHTYQNILFPLLQQFHQKHPDVLFNIFIEPREKQYKQILENNRDFGLISSRDIPQELDKVKLANISYHLYGLKEGDQPLPTKPAQLRDQTFILIGNELHYGENTHGEELLKKYGLESNKIIKLDSFVAIKEAISCGLGIGFLPHTLSSKGDKLREIPISSFTYKLPLFLVFHRHKKLTKTHKDFVNYVASHIPT